MATPWPPPTQALATPYLAFLKYYEELNEHRKYIEIELFLTNKGNKPYNHVNIEIFTILEIGFKLKSKEEFEKPKIERDFFP